MTIPPHTKQRNHYHSQQTEVYFVVSGTCAIRINKKIYHAKSGDTFIIEPRDTHALWNKSAKPFQLVVFKIDYHGDDDTTWSTP